MTTPTTANASAPRATGRSDYAPSWIDEVRTRATILDVVQRYTKLKRMGASWRGPCPLHGGKNLNFSVTPAKGTYYCFKCHETGNSFSLVMARESVSFMDAAKLMAGWYNIEVTARRRPRVRSGEESARVERQDVRARAATADRSAWAALGLESVVASLGLGTESDPELGPLVTIPVGPLDAPHGWRRYRIAVDPEGRIAPVAIDFEEAHAGASDILVGLDGLQYERRRDELLLVDEPVTAIALRESGYRGAIAPAAGLPEDGAPWLTLEQCQQLVAAGAGRLTCFVPTMPPAAQRALYATEVIAARAGLELITILPTPFEALVLPGRDGEASSWLLWDHLATPTDADGDLDDTSDDDEEDEAPGAADPFPPLALGVRASATAALRALTLDNARALDVFQTRVAMLAAALTRRGATLTPEAARDKVIPTLRAAFESGNAVLYQAYVAWATRGLRLQDRFTLATRIVAHGAAASEEF